MDASLPVATGDESATQVNSILQQDQTPFQVQPAKRRGRQSTQSTQGLWAENHLALGPEIFIKQLKHY